AAVRLGDPTSTRRLADLRAAVERYPRHAALKHTLAVRGVPVREDVRRPLRQLTDIERREVDNELPRWFELAGLDVADGSSGGANPFKSERRSVESSSALE